MTSAALPQFVERCLARAHPSWQPHLRLGLLAMLQARPDYFSVLSASEFLPTDNRLFAAFSVPLDAVQFVLMGEGPYPRAASATGVCFMDGAVGSLWQPGAGLSKAVNRATSLRNFIKMLLVAEGVLTVQNSTAGAMAPVADVACAHPEEWIQSGADLQANMMRQGFLLLNASLVFRPGVAPLQDAKAWLPFLQVILQALAARSDAVKLILWGRIAAKIREIPQAMHFTALVSEHPYNLSFIDNLSMQNLFADLHLLKRPGRSAVRLNSLK